MSTSSGERNPVELLAEDFLDRRRRGEQPTLQEYLDRHPELADEIRDLFPALLLMEDLGENSGGTTGSLAADNGLAVAARLERLGDYRILREIGRGGMGVVYEAEQESLGRRVALKVLSAGSLLDPKQVRRFEREARAAAKLHHTNIVPVFGVGRQDGHHYFVMQFIAGLGLDAVLDDLRRLRQGKSGASPAAAPEVAASRIAGLTAANVARSLIAGRFAADAPAADGSVTEPFDDAPPAPTNVPPADPSSAVLPGTSALSSSDPDRQFYRSVARIGVQVAEALEYANRQGILHRDVKPSNLLLDNHGNVWVADFGLAKTSDADDLTHTGDILGTIRYMAPERFEGKCDARSDVYSLGLTLYELVALRPAYEAADRHGLMERVLHEEPERLRRLAPSVPRDLETIIAKAMARELAGRYATAGALADDLRRFVEDRPIRARRVGPVERLARWAARNPWVAGLGAAVFALLVVTAVVTSVMSIRLREKAEEVKGEATRANLALESTNRANSGLRVTQEQLRRTLYAARVGLAQAAWDANNLGRMLDLLEPRDPERGEPDRRGFEWHYLWRLCHSDLRTVTLPGFRPVGYPTFSFDGTRVAAVVRDGRSLRLRVWDTATGELLLDLGGPSADPDQPVVINRPVFSRDGRRIAAALTVGLGGTGDQSREIKVWDAVTGEVVGTISQRVEFRVVGLALSPDGRRLAATVGPGRSDPLTPIIPRGRLLVWDVETARLLFEPPGDGWFGFLDFSPDGLQVAVAGQVDPETPATADLRVQIWHVEDGRAGHAFVGSGFAPGGVAFSPDGRLLSISWFSGAETGTLKVYETATGRERCTIPEVTGWFEHVAFSPDGRRLARASGQEASVTIRDVATGRPVLTHKGHTSPIFDVAFSPDGDRVYSVGSDATVKVWAARGRMGPADAPLRGKSALDVALCPGGFFAATLANERNRYDELVVVDPSGRAVARIERGGYDLGFTAISPDGTRVAAIEYRDGGRVDVRAWEVADVRKSWNFSGPDLGSTDAYRFDLTFNADGTRLGATFCTSRPGGAGLGTVLQVWDAATRRPLLDLSGGPGAFTSVAFSPDGRRIATGQRARPGANRVELWDAGDGRPLRSLEGHDAPINWLAFSPDGLSLASSSGDDAGTGDVRVWDVITGERRLTLTGHAHGVSMVTFSPDGRRIATTGRALAADGEVKLWDAASGQELLTLRSASGSVNRAVFTADGMHLLATGPVSAARRSDPVQVWDATPLSER